MRLRRDLPAFATVALVLLGLTLLARPAAAALVMRIDTVSDTFFIEGSDTGSAQYQPFDPSDPQQGGTYFLQFIYYFLTAVPQSFGVTNNPQNFFVQATTFSMFGQMNMITNFGQEYVFMDLSSGSSDITALTGQGPSAAVSYAGLPAANIPLFESLIGTSLVLSTGTGYSSISVTGVPVTAVPEPATWVLPAGGFAALGFGVWRRRKRA
jgi:hypothetical protein